MAVITISRQVAALGDETASLVAEKLGYKFINRKIIENEICKLGFPAEKLKKYDEKKPGFFASLTNDRDEYLNYLQTAILQKATEGNCILIGRGAFVILQDLENLVSFRLVANKLKRIRRIEEEFGWNEKRSIQRVEESDKNRAGFHKSFFNIDNAISENYDLVLNTGRFDIYTSAEIIVALVKKLVTSEKELQGKKTLENLLKAQNLINKILFEYRLNINFLKAEIHGNIVIIHGIADSTDIARRVMELSEAILPNYEIKSEISIVQDFKAYP